MASNKQLDSIFIFIKGKTLMGAKINEQYVWNLYVQRSPELAIDYILYRDILDKLAKDGYLKREAQLLHLTVEGRNFRGYVYSNNFFRRMFNFTFYQWLLIGTITAVLGGIILWTITK